MVLACGATLKSGLQSRVKRAATQQNRDPKGKPAPFFRVPIFPMGLGVQEIGSTAHVKWQQAALGAKCEGAEDNEAALEHVTLSDIPAECRE